MKTSRLDASAAFDAQRKANPYKAGDYPGRTIEVVERHSKRNTPMMEMSIEVYGPNGDTRIIKDYLTDAPFLASKFRNLCAVCGVLQQYEDGEVNPQDLAGHDIRVKLSIEAKRPFPARNVVVDYLPAANN